MNRPLLRFTALVSIGVACLLLLVGGLLTWRLQHQLESRHQKQNDIIGFILGDPTSLAGAAIAPKLDEATAGFPEVMFIQIDDGSGNIRYRSKNLAGTTLVFPSKALTEDLIIGNHLEVRSSLFYHGRWRVVIASPLGTQRQTIRDFALISLGVWLLATGLSWPLGHWRLKKAAAAWRDLQGAISQMNADRLSARIELHDDNASLTAFTTELNQLFSRLEASFHSARGLSPRALELVGKSLHELRRQADLLQPSVAKNPGASQNWETLSDEIDRLHRMTEGVHFLTRCTDGTVSFNPQPIDLQPWLEEIVHDARLLATDKDVRVTLLRSEAGVQTVDEGLLRQLFLQLFSNALAVSPSGSEITVEAFCANDRWHLAVADEGPGLPVEQHARIFEPFVRFEHAGIQSANTGVGLGLTICERIAELHGGSMRARNPKPGVGLRVVASFPSTPAPTAPTAPEVA